jgi:hypothetical protein
MARNPELPVRLLPIAEARDADKLFQSGEASAMLAMSYIAAKKRATGAIPDLRLYRLFFWRGFFQVAAPGIRSFADLKGQKLIVSGPVGSGQSGGGDIIFQAAARRSGLDPATDFDVAYMPVAKGAAEMASGRAAAITIPSPGSTGLVMRAELAQQPMMAAMARMRGINVGQSVPLAAHIDFQNLFPGIVGFPEGQLPLGGLAATDRALSNGTQRLIIDQVAAAYAEAAKILMQSPADVSGQIAAMFASHYGPLGISGPPPMLLARSITQGDLVYRSDIAVNQVQSGLSAWLAELIGKAPDADFFPVPKAG